MLKKLPSFIASKKKYDRPTSQKLLLRRQFILGPRFIEGLKSWKRINVRTTICLTVHPDLNTHQVVHEDKSITLLGYLLDPTDPQAQDADIINNLICKLNACDSLNDFFEHTYSLGGRWILIIDDVNEIRLFHDTMGLRQVFFTNKSFSKALWCASQPGSIAEALHLEMDEEAVREFINSDVYNTWKECFWPGDTSPYKEITHLLPNHYLNLVTGTCHRYWPDRKIESLSLDKGVEQISATLQGLIKSAHERFELAFAITAGWDTRLLMAASRAVSDSLYYFSILRRENDRDVIVPSRLLSKFGFPHTVINQPDHMDEAFENIYKKNVSMAHDLWGLMAQALYNDYPQHRVCIKGNAAEIARVRFRLPEGEKLTAKKLAHFSSFAYPNEMGKNPYVIRAWERWLSALGEMYNIHILDLFYWEHWAGNFAAMAQTEWDIVQEVFTPYNCRQLLTTMLSVDEKFRDHDKPLLYKEIIVSLWPDLLNEPVNPPAKSMVRQETRFKQHMKNIERRIKSAIKDVLARTPMFHK